MVSCQAYTRLSDGCHFMSRNYYEGTLLAGVVALLAWSAWKPHDRFTWVLEVLPAIVGLVIVMVTRRRFPLSRLVLALIALHMIVLLVGGHYTYAQVPLFDWLRDTFHLARNHYDRVGHFAQGLVPALIAREVLLRTTEIRQGRLVGFLALCVAMAISAWYELFEWGVAEITGTAADAFLGTQGDVWDTQKDMGLACIGALCATILLPRLHDQSIARLENRP